MYGGGFATIPAYLRDLFGTMQLGAIHGRLITAWSMAAVIGPQLVNYVAAYRIEHGVPRTEAYNVTLYVMAGLLLMGLLCNLLVGVDTKFHHRELGCAEPLGNRLSDSPPRDQDIGPASRHLLDHRADPAGMGRLSEYCQFVTVVRCVG